MDHSRKNTVSQSVTLSEEGCTAFLQMHALSACIGVARRASRAFRPCKVFSGPPSTAPLARFVHCSIAPAPRSLFVMKCRACKHEFPVEAFISCCGRRLVASCTGCREKSQQYYTNKKRRLPIDDTPLLAPTLEYNEFLTTIRLQVAAYQKAHPHHHVVRDLNLQSPDIVETPASPS